MDCTAHHNNRNGFLLGAVQHVELVRCRAVANGLTGTNLETAAAFAIFKSPRDERGPADIRLMDCKAVDRGPEPTQPVPLWVDEHARRITNVRFSAQGNRGAATIHPGADLRLEGMDDAVDERWP